MSSKKSRKASGGKPKDDYNANATRLILGQRSVETSAQPTTDTQPGCSKQLQETKNKPPANLPIYPSATSMEEYMQKFLRTGQIKRINDFFTVNASSSGASRAKSRNSKPMASKEEKDVQPQPAAAAKEKTDKGSSTNRPPSFKQFHPDLLKLPLTKQRLAASISLGEACGFLPNLMKSKLIELKAVERQMDIVSVELQKAMRDTQTICFKLENAQKTALTNTNDLVVQAEKLMYLLSSSFRIFENLHRYGSELNQGIQAYSQEVLDYNVRVDVLLDYVMTDIFVKCKEFEKNH